MTQPPQPGDAPAPGPADPHWDYPDALHRHLAALRAGRLFHVVNYHLTPPARAGVLEQQIAGYLEHFDPVTPEHLDAWFATGRWPLRRPGFAPVFYDGHRDHVVAAQVCESLGLAGWFMPPTGFVDCPVEEQAAFCDRHDLYVPDEQPPDGRLALSWEELERIGRRHVICAHTATHAAPGDVLTPDAVERELATPMRLLTRVATAAPAVLAWRLGVPDDPRQPAFAAMRDVGYRYLVSATLVQRVRR